MPLEPLDEQHLPELQKQLDSLIEGHELKAGRYRCHVSYWDEYLRDGSLRYKITVASSEPEGEHAGRWSVLNFIITRDDFQMNKFRKFAEPLGFEFPGYQVSRAKEGWESTYNRIFDADVEVRPGKDDQVWVTVVPGGFTGDEFENPAPF